MKKLLLWQIEIIKQFNEMSNEDLLDVVLDLGGGGCFTSRGDWEYEKGKEILRERLKEWLKVISPQK